MWLESALAYLHLMAILTWVVFLSSSAALLRAEWFNGAALERLGLVDRIAWIAGWSVLVTGAARVLLSPKGYVWLLAQPLLWIKVALLALMLAAAWRTRREVLQWLTTWRTAQSLPSAADLQRLRRRVMRASHLMLWAALPAVLLARGLLTV